MNYLPTKINAGDTFDVLLSPEGYQPTDGWALHLRLVARTPGNGVVVLDGVAEGSGHRFTAAAAATAAWPADGYTAIVWATRGAFTATVSTLGGIQVVPDPRSLTAGHDGRSLAERTLADLIVAKAEWDTTRGLQRRYKIGGREMEFATESELVQKIVFWEAMVAREKSAAAIEAGGRPRNRILTRFVRPR